MEIREYLAGLARVSAALITQGEYAKADGVRIAAYHFALRRGALGTEYDLFLQLQHNELAPIMRPHNWTDCGNDGLCRLPRIN